MKIKNTNNMYIVAVVIVVIGGGGGTFHEFEPSLNRSERVGIGYG